MFLLAKSALFNELYAWFLSVTSFENAESIVLPENLHFNDYCCFDMIIVGACVRPFIGLDPRYFHCKGIMTFWPTLSSFSLLLLFDLIGMDRGFHLKIHSICSLCIFFLGNDICMVSHLLYIAPN